MGKDNTSAVVFGKMKEDLDTVKSDVAGLNKRVGVLEEQPAGGRSSFPSVDYDAIATAMHVAFRNVLKERDEEQEITNKDDASNNTQKVVTATNQCCAMTYSELRKCVADAVKAELDKRYQNKNFNVSDLTLGLDAWTEKFSIAIHSKIGTISELGGKLCDNSNSTNKTMIALANGVNTIIKQNSLKGGNALNAVLSPKMKDYPISKTWKFIWDWSVFYSKAFWHSKWLRIYALWGAWIVWIATMLICYFILKDNARLEMYREKYYMLHNACQQDKKMHETAKYIEHSYRK